VYIYVYICIYIIDLTITECVHLGNDGVLGRDDRLDDQVVNLLIDGCNVDARALEVAPQGRKAENTGGIAMSSG